MVVFQVSLVTHFYARLKAGEIFCPRDYFSPRRLLSLVIKLPRSNTAPEVVGSASLWCRWTITRGA